MEKDNFNEGILELIAYMLTAARGLVDEPAMYGPFRLLEGVSRLAGMLIEENHPEKEFLTVLKGKVDERKFSLMTDQDQFISLMDETVLDITDLLISKNTDQ